jgi:site-specific recombinase XerD
MSTPSSTERLLGHPQFAFVRCWAEGLDLSAAWNRYLYVDGAPDGRRARGELLRLLDSLRALARAHDRPELAALLRRDPDAIADRSPAPRTLDDLRAGLPDDFYSEAELVALHEAEHGRAAAASPARRRQRLRERLVLAVQWLERQGARAPQPGDAVAAWLDERVAARLAAAGITRLDGLKAHIAARGFRWHRGIARIGPEGAARIVRWLGEHAATLGPLPSSALVPAARLDTAALTPLPRIDIVPIERFVLPASRDGTAGRNRAARERCKVAAANDYEAVLAWLRLRPPATHTWRAYRKEAERFLLWAVLERRKALSDLDGDDCVAYRDFLAAPGPAWRGPRHAQRWSEAWRPFEGPLAPASQAAALTIVRTLCEWLVRRHYLDANPWDDVPRRPEAPAMPRLRALSQRQWRWVEDWLAALPPSPAARRLGFVLRFAYLTGLRLAELAAATTGRLRRDSLDDGSPAWSLMVLGKRAKWREVPLPSPAVDALAGYLADRGLAADPLANDAATPLIGKLAQNAPLTAGRLYEVLVDGFARCAREVALHDPRAAETIREATTHWLRHTHGSHAVARGVPPDVLQANLGHQSLATTSIYVQAEKKRRHRAVEAAFGAAPPSPLANDA